jgi:hypothetical protein
MSIASWLDARRRRAEQRKQEKLRQAAEAIEAYNAAKKKLASTNTQIALTEAYLDSPSAFRPDADVILTTAGVNAAPEQRKLLAALYASSDHLSPIAAGDLPAVVAFLSEVLQGLKSAYQRRFDELYGRNPAGHEADPSFGMDRVLAVALLQQTDLQIFIDTCRQRQASIA